MKSFDGKAFLPMFKELTKMSEASLEPFLAEKIAEFINFGDHSDAGVWNFGKELLDDIVYCSGATPIIMKMIDFEEGYFKCEAPEGAYKQSDGSIKNAPWRNKKNIE